MTETYQGHANRETWAFNLHWSNDQGLYHETLRQASEWMDREDTAAYLVTGEDVLNYVLGEFIVNYWREFIDELDNPSHNLRMFYREVGSWWRIDHAEVGAAVRESLENEN